ncbi:MAG: GNAT family N-acetyltransferase [Candidatus Andersenbacteria bacterium]
MLNILRAININKVQIRWLLTKADLSEVVAIERRCFEFSWTEECFRHWLGQRDCIGVVAELEDGRIAGFMIYTYPRFRILNFAVTPWAWRRGIGRKMLEKLKEKAMTKRMSHVSALVPIYCEDAIPFFQRFEDFVNMYRVAEKGVMPAILEPELMIDEDIPKVQAIEDAYFRKEKGWDLEPRDIMGLRHPHPQRRSEDSPIFKHHGLVIRTLEQEVVGYALYRYEEDIVVLDGRRGIVVREDYHRRGIGSALLSAVGSGSIIRFEDINLASIRAVPFLRKHGVELPAPFFKATVTTKIKVP